MSDYLRKRQQFILDGRPLPEKKKYTIPKVSEKRKNKIAEQSKDDDGKSDKWFEDKRKELTGRCIICGGKSAKDDDKFYRASIAHLLAKRKNMFPSVATHPDNFIELCFWGNNCHQSFDDHIITLEDIKDQFPKVWEIIVGKFLKIYPSIAEEEKRNIPEILRNYIPKTGDMI